jgi:hypothetical protein
MRFYLLSVLYELLKPLFCGLALAVGATSASAAITITNQGTTNPTLVYQDKPRFKVAPLPAVAVFAFNWGSDEFRHRAWLEWMAENGLGYGRVYPESGYA